MIVLVDTNIVLDVVQKRSPYDVPASRVWEMVEQGRVQGFVSAIPFNNIFYIARKQVGTSNALNVVKLVRQVFRTVTLDEAGLDAAISIATSDLEDAIQAAAAISIGADYVVTRNAKDFRFPGINAVTGDEFLALMPP